MVADDVVVVVVPLDGVAVAVPVVAVAAASAVVLGPPHQQHEILDCTELLVPVSDEEYEDVCNHLDKLSSISSRTEHSVLHSLCQPTMAYTGGTLVK